MLFTLVNNKNIGTFMYDTILSKRLFIFIICLGVMYSVTLFLWFYTPSFETILLFNIVRILLCIVTILCGTCLILVANKTVTDLITHTFDFWFKIYNLILLYSSVWILLYGVANDNDDDAPEDNTYEFIFLIFYHIGVALIFIFIFVLDAIPISVKLKRAALVAATLACIVETNYIYFYSQDYEWNPFNSQYSQISFKSMSLSTSFNLTIFISKPVWSDLMRCLRKTLCSKANMLNITVTDHDKGKQCQRCHTVYKRPYLKWHQY